MHHIDVDKAYREKARRELYKNATGYIELILEATSYKTAAVWLPASHPQNKTCGTLLEK